MKKFKFPLEGLLRVRDLKQKQVMAEMAEVMERVNAQRQIVEQSEANYRNEMDLFSKSQSTKESFSIYQYQTFNHYINRLEAEKSYAEEKLEEMRPELEAVQNKLIEARRQRRVVELLKERYQERYHQALRKEERKELAELNQLRQGITNVKETKTTTFETESDDLFEERAEDLRTRESRRRAEYLEQAGLTEEQARNTSQND
ncbi:MAG: flagellar export protein FliJ [Leptonema sp. (in: Bacteria)]|nr:flagellar export protein FliJ [Leptonema sp. (in: bacteria)]